MAGVCYSRARASLEQIAPSPGPSTSLRARPERSRGTGKPGAFPSHDPGLRKLRAVEYISRSEMYVNTQLSHAVTPYFELPETRARGDSTPDLLVRPRTNVGMPPQQRDPFTRAQQSANQNAPGRI